MLARIFEQAGLATILVTMMPYWSEKIGVPRTLAVEHPFGQTLGRAGDEVGQLRLLRRALEVLETSTQPGALEHWPEIWPIETEAAIAAWQPTVPSPIIAHLKPRFREILRQRRRKDI